jgi:lipopolysaccharide assembly outer membrane protein LptD (OstA)
MLRSVSLILFVFFSASVGAQGLDYNYVQGSYGRVDLDGVGFDVDGDGFGFSASFAIDENFHVFGEYQTADFNFGADLKLLELGVGYHTNISPGMDLYANLGYLDFDTNGGGGDDGFSIGLGLRGAVSEAMELFGGLDYIDFDKSDGETRATAGFVLALTETIGVGLKASLWDDVNIFQLNARLYFE